MSAGSWSVMITLSMIIQALSKDLSSARPVLLEESLAGSPLVQFIWQRLQALASVMEAKTAEARD